jgi:Domain of unknown function (DUF4412)
MAKYLPNCTCNQSQKVHMKAFSITALFFAISIHFATAQGFYLEYKMSVKGHEGSGSVSKTYYQDGNTLSEVTVNLGSFNKTVTTLLLKSAPDKIYMLNTDQKTYDEADINKKEEMKDANPNDYQVAVLGKEKVNGYNCTHVKVLNLKDSMQTELWTTTEIPGYTDYMKVKTKYTGKDNLNKALEAKGAWGFPARIVATERMGAIQLDLVKATKQSNPASLFSLDGYTKNTPNASQSSSPPPNNQQELMQKIQNMTPEERQKYLQQLLQQQNQPH